MKHFAEWYHDYMSKSPPVCCTIRSDYIDDWWEEDINAWWDEEGGLYDDYDSPYDIDPTPQHLYDDTGRASYLCRRT